MKWFFIFKFLPVPIFYTHKYLQSYQDGRSLGILAIIRISTQTSKSIHAHELEHCKQFYIFTLAGILGAFLSGFIGGSEWLYTLAPSMYFALRLSIPVFRYDMEIAAYNAALNTMIPIERDRWRKRFAKGITTHYKLNTNKYTLSRAMEDLS